MRILRAEVRHLGELRGNQTILRQETMTLLCIYGFRFRNSPPEVLQWWRSRATPSDQELRNPRLFEKPERDECLCELCAKQTAFHCSLCGLITCSLCRVDFHCDCSTRWLNLGSSLIRNTFQDVKEFVYENPGTPFDSNELLEEHKEIMKTIVNQAVKRFKKLKDDVRERRTTSASGELDRILRQDISLDEECYGVYGDPNDPSDLQDWILWAAIAALARRTQCSKFFDASSSTRTPTGAHGRTPAVARRTR